MDDHSISMYKLPPKGDKSLFEHISSWAPGICRFLWRPGRQCCGDRGKGCLGIPTGHGKNHWYPSSNSQIIVEVENKWQLTHLTLQRKIIFGCWHFPFPWFWSKGKDSGHLTKWDPNTRNHGSEERTLPMLLVWYTPNSFTFNDM